MENETKIHYENRGPQMSLLVDPKCWVQKIMGPCWVQNLFGSKKFELKILGSTHFWVKNYNFFP